MRIPRTVDMTEEAKGFSIVIPVYRSEDIVSTLHGRLTQALESLADDYEMIFVDDCSPDNSWKKLCDLASADPRVKALSLRKNVGYDNAVMAGLKFADRPYVVIMDDDLQHAPEDIPLLFDQLGKGCDVVYANFTKMHQSVLKNLGSWLNGKLAQLIINKPAGMHISSFKILRGEVVREIIKYDGPFPYIDGLIFQVTSAIDKVVLAHHKRLSGRGGHTLLRSLRIVFNFCTTFSILPLRVSTLIGFAMSLLSGIFSIILVVWKFFFGINVEGWGSIMLAVVMMGGIQLMALGILGEYIGRTYMNINRQPQYVIKHLLNGNRQSASEDEMHSTAESHQIR